MLIEIERLKTKVGELEQQVQINNTKIIQLEEESIFKMPTPVKKITTPESPFGKKKSRFSFIKSSFSILRALAIATVITANVLMWTIIWFLGVSA